MDTIFMNSENSQTSKPYVFILKLTDKLDLRRSEKSIALSNLSITTHGKTQKTHIIIINSKHQLQHGMINSNCLMDRSLYQIFRIILSVFLKSMEKILIIHQYRYM